MFVEQPELKDTEERYRKSSTGKHNQDWRRLAVYPAEKKILSPRRDMYNLTMLRYIASKLTTAVS